MKIEKIDINKLKPAKYNPRKNLQKGDIEFEKIKKSILEFGYVEPIICNKDFTIIGGHQRFKVLQELKYNEIDVVILDLDKTREKALNIALNKISGEWDIPLLKDLLQEIDTGEIDIELTGFDFDEIENLMSQFNVDDEHEAIEDDFEMQSENEIQTDIVIGDLFEIGEHRLLCGDSTDKEQVSRLMNGEKVDMVFTDPPYGMFLDTDFSSMKSEIFKGGMGGKKYYKVIGDNKDFKPEFINTIFTCFNNCKEVFIWGADYFAELIPNKNDGSWIVWDKRLNESADKMYGSTFELCWSKNKHKREIARIKWAGIFGMTSQDTKKRIHPTQKPLELCSWFFNKWGSENDLVADLYLGSGSTMVASHQLKRKCYGMEIDPKYCQVIIDRMKNLDSDLIIKKNGIVI